MFERVRTEQKLKALKGGIGYKICVILDYCKDIQILNLGNEINYKGKTYLVYNLVMYIYYRKITKSKMPSLFEPIWIELKFSNLL